MISEASLLHELGRRLVEGGDLTRQQLEDVVARGTLLDKALDRMVVDEGLVAEEKILAMLSEISGVPFQPIRAFAITAELVRRVPAHTALHYRVIPVDGREGTLTLATSHPYDATEQDSLQTLVGSGVRWVLCTRRDIEEALKHFYGLGADILKDLLPPPKGAAPETQGLDAAAESEGPGVARLVQEIVREAIQMNASDIHIEPMDNRLSLRYRIDGVLCRIPLPEGAARFRRSIVSAVKVMSQLNVTERRLPQDGRLRATVNGGAFDIRVSIVPTQYGEAANLRILNRSTSFLPLKDLGLREAQVPLMERLVSAAHGIVLITGATGSGKTTTLYATLAKLRNDGISIVTIEDPVEYQMDGVLQIQANAEIGLDFAAGLRSVLRHDPDVILIGEIRDRETADIAIKSSLTGHLVLSTLHTNDSASAITRLIDMGVEAYLVSSSLEGVVAQRLVRRICAACREPAAVPEVVEEEIRRALPDRSGAMRLVRGRGCPDCKYTGYQGRCGVFEIMPVTDAIRPMVVRRATSEDIQDVAVREGMTTLRQNAWALALDGVTTVEEVMRVTHRDRGV
jgi:type II secretory ATPase GspE/PulE/Tfp pilus assembly ATPase PilB-like protein